MPPLVLHSKGETAEEPKGNRSRFLRYALSSREASGDNGTIRDLWNFDSRIRNMP